MKMNAKKLKMKIFKSQYKSNKMRKLKILRNHKNQKLWIVNEQNALIANANLQKNAQKSMRRPVKKHKRNEKCLILQFNEIMQRNLNSYNLQHKVNFIKKNNL